MYTTSLANHSVVRVSVLPVGWHDARARSRRALALLREEAVANLLSICGTCAAASAVSQGVNDAVEDAIAGAEKVTGKVNFEELYAIK
eukprot:2015514-Alexandrium_andersonii.AAC.1